LLQKRKSQEAHMQASMICTSNDVIANLGSSWRDCLL